MIMRIMKIMIIKKIRMTLTKIVDDKIIPARWQLLPVQPRMGHFVTFLRLEQISAIHQLQCKVGAVNCSEIQAWCKEQYREI